MSPEKSAQFDKDALLHKLQDEADKWEDVPDKDLWEDGELNSAQVQHKIINHVLQIGDWKLVRRRDDGNK